MKIDPGSGIKPLENIRKKQPANPAAKTVGAMQGDKVVFSKELKQLQSKESPPPIDAEREARLKVVKEQIANGSYSPDSKKVAVSLLKYIAEGNGRE